MSAILASVKNKINRNALFNLLVFIAEGTKSAGFAFVPLEEAKKLQKAEPTFIAIDENVKNESGQVKATATDTAIKALDGSGASIDETTTETASTPAAAEPVKYEYVKLAGIPEIQRGGKKGDSYAFDSLKPYPNEPHAIFIPKSEARPNPAKSLAGTVGSANKRTYPGPDTKRTFTIRRFVHSGIEGALIIRTA